MRHIWEKVWATLAKTADVAGVLAFLSISFSIPVFFPADRVAQIYAYFMCGLNVCLILYIATISVRKRHRYADAIQHTHFVNHNIRDWLCRLRRMDAAGSRPPDFGSDYHANTAKLLDQIADAFTQITGKRCAVCIKEMRPSMERVPDAWLSVVHRDPLSQQTRGVCDGINPPHQINHDTPCHVIFTASHPDSTYLCNNVIAEWADGRYSSAAFHRAPYNQPKVTSFGSIRFARNWPLRYSSCLVAPIRCQTPSANGGKPGWDYWGFLCIDCPSRNVFDRETAWLLAGTFADVLYVYFSHTFGKIKQENPT